MSGPFDLNGDGKLDWMEQALEAAIIDEIESSPPVFRQRRGRLHVTAIPLYVAPILWDDSNVEPRELTGSWDEWNTKMVNTEKTLSEELNQLFFNGKLGSCSRLCRMYTQYGIENPIAEIFETLCLLASADPYICPIIKSSTDKIKVILKSSDQFPVPFKGIVGKALHEALKQPIKCIYKMIEETAREYFDACCSGADPFSPGRINREREINVAEYAIVKDGIDAELYALRLMKEDGKSAEDEKFDFALTYLTLICENSGFRTACDQIEYYGLTTAQKRPYLLLYDLIAGALRGGSYDLSDVEIVRFGIDDPAARLGADTGGA